MARPSVESVRSCIKTKLDWTGVDRIGSYLDRVGHIGDWIGSVVLVGSVEFEARRALDRVGLKEGGSVMFLTALLNAVVDSDDAMVCFQ